MQTLTREISELSQALSEPIKRRIQFGEETISVSQTVSAAAVIYEAARNAVEFRAEHLIRRAAIERILKRKILINHRGEGVAEALIRELLWARYLENGAIPKKLTPEVQEIINKYLALRAEVLKQASNKEKTRTSNWILGIASCEIEKKLAPAPHREALINFVYQTLKKRIELTSEDNPKTHDIQIYVAVHRGFALSDEPIIRFHLFVSFFPDWLNLKPEGATRILPQFNSAFKEIEKQLNHPLKGQIHRFVVHEVAPFNVIRDLTEESPTEFTSIILNPIILEEKTIEILDQRYQETGAKLRRAAIRSIIYIFLTKMLLAFLLELPFDLLIGRVNWKALAVNSFFPPFLMFLSTVSIQLPDEENTQRIVAKIKEYTYQESPVKTTVELTKESRRKTLSLAFTLIYFLTYFLIFGGIIYFLNRFHFNPVSQAIFLFFLTVVSFFAYRVRLMTKSYEIKEKEGIISPIVDFLFLPILRVGQWLSAELAQINIIIFIFDFIVEAPFKAFFAVIEEWIHFVRSKQEEITT